MWQKWSITKKIWFSLAILVAGYLASMLFGFYLGQKTEYRLNQVSEVLIPAAVKSHNAVYEFSQMKKHFYDAFMLGEESLIEDARGDFMRMEDILLSLSGLKGLAQVQQDEVRKILDDLIEYVNASESTYREMINEYDAAKGDKNQDVNGADHTLNIRASELDEKGKVFYMTLLTLSESFDYALEKELSSIRDATKRQRYLNMAVFFAVVITALTLISVIVRRSIVRPLEKTYMLENAVKQSTDGIAVTDLEGRLLFVNRAWARIHGFEEGDIKGAHLSSFHNPDQMTMEVAPFKERVIKFGSQTGEIGHRRKDDSVFPAQETASLLKKEDGSPLNLLIFCKDITEQKQAEEELLRIMQAVEASPDAIGISDPYGNHFYQNPAFTKMFGYELEEFKKDVSPQTLSSDAAVTHNVFKEIMNGNSWTGEVEVVNKDGLKFPVICRANAIKDKKGNIIGLVNILTDITERKKAEAALSAVQKELVEKAHQAGMADIATGTLHNVGNILNSVKTSAQVISDFIHTSSVHGFKKANAMLREQMDNIEEFIASNPKGKKLMQYYLKLEEGFIKEHEYINEHIVRLTDKIGAIEQVISAQQSYAGTSALTEDYDLAQIVEDSLIMQSGSTQRYGIDVVKDFHPVPKVAVQKTKLIHILINIIKNAKESMIEAQIAEKRLTVSLDMNDAAIFLKVADTGMGVQKENIEKIFSHGFTTKKDGHGFGLHSSANYMTEMGGRMWAESDGIGKGATFVLRFPRSDAA